MIREADYTIKGFLYQFNKSLEEILSSKNGEEITIEGIIEDIDVVSEAEIRAIQCKYHETKQFKLSDVYKPILQMMVNYVENDNKKIKYILYAHFADQVQGVINLSKDDFSNIIYTQNLSYITKYISKLIPPKDPEIESFLLKRKRTAEENKSIRVYYSEISVDDLPFCISEFTNPDLFEFIVGSKFDDLVVVVKQKMCEIGDFSTDDVEDIFYPNAIQRIADTSIIHNHQFRVVEKQSFIDKLRKSKKTAITRWTKELSTYNSLLKKRRSQLKSHLQQNDRVRYVVFDVSSFEKFDSEIVSFMVEFVNKYNSKKLHRQTPLFAFDVSSTSVDLNDIFRRLYAKKVECASGYIGDKFFQSKFLKEPKRISKDKWVEFKLRLCVLSDDTYKAINSRKCEDFYLVGSVNSEKIDLLDINVERLEVTSFKELRYLLHMSSDL
ncbi:hypothetical protein SAMN05660337_3358 [Maridesulfovibrio ferrireducens]|uniref:DUF4297 domain-containing protein n=1 Tax=Maridesulfovibrio ferrireducens TaxID=246191 RepID=A0A1G9LF74_9BACT|nr:hypothetical protein [Maridesulfovibrio ferrireducens]SDL60526.1 hypothetical protein SAMN05660337_3358 [Maridesulfovibrio ferrireducens]